jgi:hypothetical protein
MLFAEILLILALIGLIATLIWVIVAALALKAGAVRDAKRLYERPLTAVKSLAAVGKGIAQQEMVRVHHVSAEAKETIGVVRETATELKGAVTDLTHSDIKALLHNAQTALKFLSIAAQFARSVSKQGATASSER